MKFTKEEINLCKQIAEKCRVEIARGDWLLNESGEICLAERIKKNIMISQDGYSFRYVTQENSAVIPLWTISDCLEFFEEKNLKLYFQFFCFPSGNWRFTAEDNRYGKVRGEGETRLAACLLAVLVALEEK